MVHDLIKSILQYLHYHPYMGELFAFLVAFTESLPIIGTIIPGSVTMTAIGTLVGASIIPGFATFFWATIGALTGDCIGFWIGKHYKEKIPHVWPFRKYPKWLILGEEFFKKHGGKSVFIGRFVGPARSTVPLVAGLLKLSWFRFLSVAVPSAFLWALAYLLPGVILGAVALELPPGKTTEVMIIGLIVIVFIWFIFWILQRFFREIIRAYNAMVDKFWAWLYRHHSSKFIIQYITNQRNPNDHYQLSLILLAILFGCLYLVLFALVIACKTFVHSVNEPIFYFLQSLRVPSIDTFMVLVTMAAMPIVTAPATLIIAIGLMLKRNRRAAYHFITLILLTFFAIGFFKYIYFSPRPTGFMIVANTSSFPSGHTMDAFAFFGFLAFITTEFIERKWHWIPYSIASILIFLVGLSRMYLGAHWFFDILGSITLGFAILLPVIMHYRRYPKQSSTLPVKMPLWVGLIVIGIFIPWSGYVFFKYPKVHFSFTAYSVPFKITTQQWWENPNEYLPIYRNNRFGNPIAPFNIQWAANLNTVQKTLLNEGWRVLKKKPFINFALAHFSNTTKSTYRTTFLPQLYLNQPPVLTFIKTLADSKDTLQLKLWKSNIDFTNQSLPVWIGSVDLQLPPHKAFSLSLRYLSSYSSPILIPTLQKDLSKFNTKIITTPIKTQPKNIQRLSWDGKVMVVMPSELSTANRLD